MKKAIVFIVSFCLFAVLNSACDPCKDKDCGQYGDCNDGECECKCGASKDTDGKCSIDGRAPYNGSYAATANASNGSSFPNFEFRCNPIGTTLTQIEFDLSAIGFPKFKGNKGCTDDNVSFDMVDEATTGDKYSGSAIRTGNILTITVNRTTSIGSAITYTITGNKK